MEAIFFFTTLSTTLSIQIILLPEQAQFRKSCDRIADIFTQANEHTDT